MKTTTPSLKTLAARVAAEEGPKVRAIPAEAYEIRNPIYADGGPGPDVYECSVCGRERRDGEQVVIDRRDYCPDCAADYDRLHDTAGKWHADDPPEPRWKLYLKGAGVLALCLLGFSALCAFVGCWLSRI